MDALARVDAGAPAFVTFTALDAGAPALAVFLAGAPAFATFFAGAFASPAAAPESAGWRGAPSWATSFLGAIARFSVFVDALLVWLDMTIDSWARQRLPAVDHAGETYHAPRSTRMNDPPPTRDQGSGAHTERARLRRVMRLSLALAAGCAVTLGITDGPLRTPEAPHGIVSFELAWSSARAAEMRASWDQTARLHVAFSLGFDYLFLCAYGALAWSLMRLRAVALARAQRPRWARACRSLAFAAWAAAGLDALENAALWRVLADPAAPWPALATALASAKFALLALLLSLWLTTWPMTR